MSYKERKKRRLNLLNKIDNDTCIKRLKKQRRAARSRGDHTKVKECNNAIRYRADFHKKEELNKNTKMIGKECYGCGTFTENSNKTKCDNCGDLNNFKHIIPENNDFSQTTEERKKLNQKSKIISDDVLNGPCLPYDSIAHAESIEDTPKGNHHEEDLPETEDHSEIRAYLKKFTRKCLDMGNRKTVKRNFKKAKEANCPEKLVQVLRKYSEKWGIECNESVFEKIKKLGGLNEIF